MKYLFTLLVLSLTSTSVFAQAPEKISYQAVIRNASNQLVQNTNVGMQISILQGSATGTVVFQETHSGSTNINGLVSIEIGSGTSVTGSLSGIDWHNGPYFIKTETDPNGQSNYTISGTSQLLSVPYALYTEKADQANSAYTADSLIGGITEVDGSVTNETITGMYVSGDSLLVDEAGVTHAVDLGLASLDADFDSGWVLDSSNVHPNTNYHITSVVHNLGGHPTQMEVWFTPDTLPNAYRYPVTGMYHWDNGAWSEPSLRVDAVHVQWGLSDYMFASFFNNNQPGWTHFTKGYYRVLLWK